MAEAWIIDAVRTPRGRGKKESGALSHIHPQELFAQSLQALSARHAFDPKDVEDVVVGCVTEAGEQGGCIARMATLVSGWPTEVTGVSLNRFCGSGQQAVNFALMGVLSGQQDLVVGGGVESMSRQPMGSDGAGIDGHNRHLREMYPLVPQGISADLIATIEGFSRDDVDRFALSSQQRAKAAIEEGRFEKSVVPVKNRDGTVALDREEFPRPQTTLEALGKLEPSFVQLGKYVQKGDELSFDEKVKKAYPQVRVIEHVHTAGNSSGIVDGAAAVLIASPDYARAHGLKPRARVRAMATHGAEPVIMLTAPVPATERCLKKAGMVIEDIDLIEINEAFAAVPLKVIRDCRMDPERVNVNGGAIALGHPLGATGAMLIGTVLDELERRDRATGLVTMCIGGGMGITTILERV
ncbi:MAG: acetyl-CoA C-acetyltransferase [Myxococcales bacterium]|jgi:acetyl-CoA C-acetyltransferase|nr:acetyl-CoA C-acetyltransferase [Myxococcales bacterium]